MINRIRAARTNGTDEGFTLIEMLIVIVVLGVLAGITVFGVSKFREDAEASACDATVKTVSVAVDAYKVQKKGAVPTVDQLIAANYIKETPDYPIAISSTGVVTSTACPAPVAP